MTLITANPLTRPAYLEMLKKSACGSSGDAGCTRISRTTFIGHHGCYRKRLRLVPSCGLHAPEFILERGSDDHKHSAGLRRMLDELVSLCDVVKREPLRDVKKKVLLPQFQNTTFLVLPAVSIGQKSEVANLDEADRQDMEQETTDELHRIELHDLDAVVMFGVAPAKTHLSIDQAEQSAVGDGDAMGVAG